jgi:protein-tyrosine phosphatase
VSVARDLVWDGCSNVRDLGGHSTASGGETRFGAVVRSDTRAHLTDAGWEALLAYGVSRIVDLRRDDELADDPPREARARVEIVHVSLMAGYGSADPSWRAMVAAADATPDALGQYVLFYGWALEHRADAIVRALAAVASAPPGAVVVHCVGGKDRTGLVAGLLLRLCGVSLEDVDADYALTEERLRPTLGEVATAPAGAMAAVLDRLERRHGSVEAYLLDSGLAPEAVDALRARLCG